ncbi:hypothetical protein FDJ44_gp46 [Microbacterium phage Pikmin]|uniref:Uncharacterized protein n=2 Tax=Pikminvirus pikmin TaxID=2560596 RepID=A0A2P1CIE7_9CAUD|nr:hypothetical protein FDJ44_gp46 [Microbacterium phage Pikmin]AVJ51037.1 hypothetical protein PBI_PAJAZA_46 [Microbacterium phage Pajaza]AVJ51184.1 hypothetical protein PBI_PIKMIN_46 [Microbacterium phage Pikmin]
MAKRVYYREPESASESREKVDELLDSGVISQQLAEAFYIALDHQAQLDYDGLTEEFNETDNDDLKQLFIDTGIVIQLSEEQTRRVKYGV